MKYSEENIDGKKVNSENSKIMEKFLSFLHVDGCSNNTIIAYRNDLKQLEKLNNFDNLLDNADEKFQNFVSNIKSKGGVKLSYISLLRKISAIRVFYRFLFEEKIISSLPKLMMNFELGKIKRSPPKMLAKSEIDILIDGCKDKQILNIKQRFEWLMMEALIEFLYSTGARISEALSVKINQIFDNTGNIVQFTNVENKEKVLTGYILKNLKITSNIAAVYKLKFEEKMNSALKIK
jgi:integrase/recombinase XerD